MKNKHKSLEEFIADDIKSKVCMGKVCGNCKQWNKNEHNSGYGFCSLVEKCITSIVAIDRVGHLKNDNIYVDSDYYAEFEINTGKNFGCIHWEGK